MLCLPTAPLKYNYKRGGLFLKKTPGWFTVTPIQPMTPAKTFTGDFPIGFRRVGSEWQKNPEALARWAVENRFGFVDVGKSDAAAHLTTLAQAGLRPGSADLLDGNGYRAMIAPDSAARQEAIAATHAHIEACAAVGASIFFTVTIPGDKLLPRKQNFEYLVESYAALIPALERSDSRVVIEGWPGPGAVCCTPETYRAFFREVGSDRFGVNYDPSHLLRMGIDPLRFLKEFAGRVYHVHAKDTAVSSEELYEFGHEQPATFAKGHGWGGTGWRYTLPGHGLTDWIETFRVLRDTGFSGLVSIELEDENFNGTEAGEQRGLSKSREFLEGC